MNNSQEAAREIGLDPTRPTVLITGSSRGIGLGFARRYADDGWNVIATVRNPAGTVELKNLAARVTSVVVEELDVLNDTQLELLAIKYVNVPIDVLINNAAFHGGKPDDHRLGTYSYSTFERYMAVNVFGPLKISEAFSESVAKSNQKKIVTLTTRLSCLTSPSPINAFHFQAISKTALNRAIRALQLELRQTGIIAALISPGRVDTDGLAASRAAVAASLRDGTPLQNQPPPLSVEQSVAAMVRVIADLDESYDGSHLDLHGNIIPW
jgi:NAD(P)-dependent dehydrogenase (short-subunit alcohol dehydrogenase family)